MHHACARSCMYMHQYYNVQCTLASTACGLILLPRDACTVHFLHESVPQGNLFASGIISCWAEHVRAMGGRD